MPRSRREFGIGGGPLPSLRGLGTLQLQGTLGMIIRQENWVVLGEEQIRCQFSGTAAKIVNCVDALRSPVTHEGLVRS